MKFELTIESNGAGMVDETETAVSDILKEVSNSVFLGMVAGNLYDINGHKVGSWSLVKPRK